MCDDNHTCNNNDDYILDGAAARDARRTAGRIGAAMLPLPPAAAAAMAPSVVLRAEREVSQTMSDCGVLLKIALQTSAYRLTSPVAVQPVW